MTIGAVRITRSSMSTSVILFVFIVTLFMLLFSYSDTAVYPRRVANPIQIDNSFKITGHTYQCQSKKCVRTAITDDSPQIQSLATCNMICGAPAVWPKPRKLTIDNQNTTIINLEKTAVTSSCNNTNISLYIDQAIRSFRQSFRHAIYDTGAVLAVNLIIADCSISNLELTTDESYKLLIKNDDGVHAHVFASNYFGVRHGLETLSQLIWYDPTDSYYKILTDVSIEDGPKFAYRGVMVDVARNYMPMELLHRVVNAMAMSKLNVLHLHLTDAVSFPVVLPRVPELAQFGAYSPEMIYTAEELKALREYAKPRGVRVIFEIDAPSHVNAGWEFEDDLVLCPEIDNGVLNPDNGRVFQVLENIYEDLLELNGQAELFHIGSDEVDENCWKRTKAFKDGDYHSNIMEFWSNFTNQMILTLQRANQGTLPGKIIMWSSPLTASKQFTGIDGDLVVQSWLGNPGSVFDAGKSVIYSTVGHWYLDCGFGPWKTSKDTGNCDPFANWVKFYSYRPWDKRRLEKTLGGEVCLWSEQVNADQVELRLWPRTAAFAERVWTDPDGFDTYDVSTRLISFQDRLNARGFKTAQIWPRWCSENPGKC